MQTATPKRAGLRQITPRPEVCLVRLKGCEMQGCQRRMLPSGAVGEEACHDRRRRWPLAEIVATNRRDPLPSRIPKKPPPPRRQANPIITKDDV
jgi:hypothetical protein